MASNDKSEDEILGLDASSSSLDRSKNEEDISNIEEDMLLLSSPSPSPAIVEKSETPGYQAGNSSTSLFKPGPSTSTEPKTIEVNDDDDEPEIIDDDSDQDEVQNLNDSEIITDEEEDEDDFYEEELESEESIESEESTSFMDGKISIHCTNGAFLLWNADDVQMLREECRIIGKLIGCLPRAPRQNNQLGLPLQLMPEEARLLVDIDAAVVVTEEPVSSKTMKVREAAFKNVRATNFRIQQKLYKENRKEEVRQRMPDIIAGKKAKKRKHQDGTNKGNEDQTEKSDKQSSPKRQNISPDGIVEGKESENVGDKTHEEAEDDADQLTVDDIVSSTAETSEKHTLVQIFTENPWKQSSRPTDDWMYPGTERELLRYHVFKDLWEKGFYLTSGAKFGGDFLVYPGDPARFHSHYIAVCKSQHEELPCLDIISLGRLASNVRKTALLCALDRHGKVFYTSLQWSGIS